MAGALDKKMSYMAALLIRLEWAWKNFLLKILNQLVKCRPLNAIICFRQAVHTDKDVQILVRVTSSMVSCTATWYDSKLVLHKDCERSRHFYGIACRCKTRKSIYKLDFPTCILRALHITSAIHTTRCIVCLQLSQTNELLTSRHENWILKQKARFSRVG